MSESLFLPSLLLVLGLGCVAGILLGIASKVFYVWEDPRIAEVENCLAGANIETIGELVVMPEPEMLKFRNFGKKSLTEIKKKLDKMGLSLGMDLSRFGITRENIKQVIEKYLEEIAGNIS